MTNRVTRDGDTVTVRDYLYPGDTLIVTPYKDGFVIDVREVEQSDDIAGIITSRDDLATLAYHLLALAGEPDWKTIEGKLYGRQDLSESEYAALEGAENGK